MKVHKQILVYREGRSLVATSLALAHTLHWHEKVSHSSGVIPVVLQLNTLAIALQPQDLASPNPRGE